MTSWFFQFFECEMLFNVIRAISSSGRCKGTKAAAFLERSPEKPNDKRSSPQRPVSPLLFIPPSALF